MREGFDYIVVGGGSAGCALASRLSERPEVSVLLLEAGGADRSVLLKMPLAFRVLRNTMKFDWHYASEPEPQAGGRRIAAARGRVLGGSSSVNGLMYSRGQPQDYDGWVRAGAPGWSFEEVLPLFRRSERSWRGASRWHGADGPMGVERMRADDPLTQALFAAASRLGCELTDDFDGPRGEGIGLPDLTTRRGQRASASQAFLRPATGRPNLTVRTNAHATRVVVENGRAVGVEYLHRQHRHAARAACEVILCGGAYASPQLLMLSGIGPAGSLHRLGLAVHADLPGVGENLQEHPLVPMGFGARQPFAFGRALRADRLACSVLRWGLTGAGMAGTQPLSAIAYYRSAPDVERADLENILIPTGLDAHVWFPGVRRPRPDLLTSLNVLLRPHSRGSVRLRSADALQAPEIRFNLLAEPADVDRLRRAIRWTRELVRQSPACDLVGDESFPGVQVGSDAALDAYMRATVVTGQHPAGTCRMGEDSLAVVDSRLAVRGVERLRVADASIMPLLVSGHTNAPCVMIGEKAADLLLEAR